MLKNLSIQRKLLLIAAGPILAIVALAALSILGDLGDSSDASDRERRAEMIEANGSLFNALRAEAVANQIAVATGNEDVADFRNATDAAISVWGARAAEFGSIDTSGLILDVADIDAHRLDVAPQYSSNGAGAERVYLSDIDLLTRLAAFDGAVAASADGDNGARIRQAGELSSVAFHAADLQLLGVWATYATEAPRVPIADRVAAAIISTGSYNERAEANVVIGDVPEDYSNQLNRFASLESGDAVTVTSEAWIEASEARAQLLHNTRSAVAADATAIAAETSSSARSSMRNTALLALVGLLAGVILAVVIGRALSAGLRRVRDDAMDLAENDMPRLVGALTGGTMITADELRGGEETIDPGADEFGEIATGLRAVRQSATGFLGEVGQLQDGVADTFVNLARRNQALVDRQLEAIDELEAREHDADRLAQMYRVDHLATRMRRNAESLLVVAGKQTPQRRGPAVSLREVVRVAIGEVEDYRRIIPIALDDLEIAGHVAQDLAHLLAELMENGTQHSAPGTAVDVLGGFEADGDYTVKVVDRGTGLTEAQLAEHNGLLADPPTSTFDLPRALGLTVVARLADRLGVSVELSGAADGGTTAAVAIPASVIENWSKSAEAAAPHFTALSEQPPVSQDATSDPEEPQVVELEGSSDVAIAEEGASESPFSDIESLMPDVPAHDAPTVGEDVVPQPIEAVEPETPTTVEVVDPVTPVAEQAPPPFVPEGVEDEPEIFELGDVSQSPDVFSASDFGLDDLDDLELPSLGAEAIESPAQSGPEPDVLAPPPVPGVPEELPSLIDESEILETFSAEATAEIAETTAPEPTQVIAPTPAPTVSDTVVPEVHQPPVAEPAPTYAPAPEPAMAVSGAAPQPDAPPAEANVTSAGLIRRVRTENAAAGESLDDVRTAPSKRSPEQVKSMLSRYKTGLEKGRGTIEQDGES
ncbi:MAG: ATP-binding protein [Acidimicrobiales bacterium]